MGENGYLRLRKSLASPLGQPQWSQGIEPVAFDAIDPRQPHALLEQAFPGLIAPFPDWLGNLTTDSEFDAALCISALNDDGAVVGFIQCWTSNFIKDLAVSSGYRGLGIGSALMQRAFLLFADRGAAHVDLKVEKDNARARQLYARLGMTSVEN